MIPLISDLQTVIIVYVYKQKLKIEIWIPISLPCLLSISLSSHPSPNNHQVNIKLDDLAIQSTNFYSNVLTLYLGY